MSYIAIQTASFGTGEYMFLATTGSNNDIDKIIDTFRKSNGQLKGADFLIFKREKSFKENNGSRIGVETILFKGIDVSKIKPFKYEEIKEKAFKQFDDFLKQQLQDNLKLPKGKSLHLIYPHSPKDLISEVIEYVPKKLPWVKFLLGLSLGILLIVGGIKLKTCLTPPVPPIPPVPGTNNSQPKVPSEPNTDVKKTIQNLLKKIGIEAEVQEIFEDSIKKNLKEKYNEQSLIKIFAEKNNLKNTIEELDKLYKKEDYIELIIELPLDGSFSNRASASAFSDFCKNNSITGTDLKDNSKHFKDNTKQIIDLRKKLRNSNASLNKNLEVLLTNYKTFESLNEELNQKISGLIIYDYNKVFYDDVSKLFASIKKLTFDQTLIDHPIITEDEVKYFNELNRFIETDKYKNFKTNFDIIKDALIMKELLKKLRDFVESLDNFPKLKKKK